MNKNSRKLFRLIRRGEGQFVEFKRKVNHPEKIVKEAVAFANAQGGNLFIGIDDDGFPTGLKYPEEEEFVLSKAIRELCKPEIAFEVDFVKIKEDIRVLNYRISEGHQKPYFAFLEKHHKYGKAFIRVKDQSLQASYEVRQILKKQHQSNTLFTYEEKTKELFRFFDRQPYITVSQYSELTGMNKKIASNKLIHLTLSGALKIEPQEGEDIFSPT